MTKRTLGRKILFFAITLVVAKVVLPLSPAKAANIGIVVNGEMTETNENIFYGNATGIDPDGSLMLLQNQNVSKFRIDRSGNVTATKFTGDGSGLTGVPGTTQWTTNGSNIYYNSGNVGIGTTNPTGKLGFENDGSGLAWGSGPFSRIYDDGDFNIWTDDNMYFNNSGGGRVTILGNGNVGIGATNPTNKLQVSGGNLYVSGGTISSDNNIGNKGTNIGQVMERGSSAVTTLRFDSDAYRIYAGGTGGSGEILRVAENGNIGIGTTNPTGKLGFENDGSGLAWGSGPFSRIYDDGDFNIWTDDNIYFRNSGGERIVVTGDGDIGIGVSSPGVKLDVDGTIRASGIVYASGGVNTDGVSIKQKVYSGFTSGAQNGLRCIDITGNFPPSSPNRIISIDGVIIDSRDAAISPLSFNNEYGWQLWYENGSGPVCGSGKYLVIYPTDSSSSVLQNMRFNIVLTYF